MLRKCFCFLITTVTLISSCCLSTATYATENCTITVERTSAATGDSVLVNLDIKNNPGIMAMSISITYDPEALTYVGYYKGDIFSDYIVATHPDKKHIRLIISERKDKTEDGTVISFEFKVTENAEVGLHEMTVEYSSGDFCNYDLERIMPTIVAGGVEVIDANTSCSHDTFGEWTVEIPATCTVVGIDKRICTQCSHTEFRKIGKLGHSYSKDWTIDEAATCTNSGIKSRQCIRCDSAIDKTTIPATGHSYEYEWHKYPTENQSGIYLAICKNCSEILPFNIPYIKLKNIIFTNNKIECRFATPQIDESLPHLIVVLYQVDGVGMQTKLSKDETYNIFTLEDTSFLRNTSNINIQLWFGAGEIPYNISVLENLEYSFEEICKDVNGDAQHNSLDLTLLRKKLINTTEIRTGDTNADGTVDLKDLVSLKKYLIA